MDKAAVIGANGFLGSHLVDALALEGFDITAFDRFSSRPSFDAASPRVLAGDFLSRSDLDDAVAGQRFVFHFLSTTTPATAAGDPTLDIRTNVAQTVELLESCASAGVERIFYASTGGAIYGDQGRTEYAESDRALPVSPYGIGKLTIEHYLEYFRLTHGLDYTILRISNPYGTRQHPNRKQGLIPIALRRIANGEPVVQFGDGGMVRDYIYVEDLVRMIMPLVRDLGEHRLYNMGSGIGSSVAQILDVLRQVTGEDFAIDVRPAPPTFVDRVVLDTSRYVAEFGALSPATGLYEGVERTFEEIRRQND
ncbi:NAD-dependent epimerase/dehydratase family protein [Leifsonia aquatica]|uniref:NAD-dependent epimerase/dehydratase family protein n=1 Tax=Leifsonia aquatica TaxID=144185 RepID=UPI0028AC385C|nr:NAD-dependent epimerase/dehydratase family protein [Leifsonia aquatica]